MAAAGWPDVQLDALAVFHHDEIPKRATAVEIVELHDAILSVQNMP